MSVRLSASEQMRRSIMRRLGSHGGQCDHLSQCTLSDITHMFLRTFFLVLVCGTRAQIVSAPFTYIPYILSRVGGTRDEMTGSSFIYIRIYIYKDYKLV
jgi:hypothetical protein